MSTDVTEAQGGQERRRSREMSLKRGCPPTPVPGYDPERFLGLGAYGEVWVAVERNTGRRVAIKFYAHRGGLDWSLLSREVEKLAFLFADRYVVQLLAVGWEAEPPYYVMEYLERGSLADRLQQGPLPAREAIDIFRDVATGLAHAHGKGVLHCDLKPANILLDQDNKPRLADFGQSRLSNEQVPALGTMFYMAPEQADLEAVPDVRWDVYALGALLYCMLTGSPPHRHSPTAELCERTPDLKERLARYRQMIETAPPATEHSRVRGVDHALAAIIDRCLAPDPKDRFPNVHAVLAALDERASRRARRPLMVLGAVGPALLLLVVAWFAWQGFSAAVRQSNEALTNRALESNLFAAENVARAAGTELEQRFLAVEEVASSLSFREGIRDALGKPELRDLLDKLNDPKTPSADLDRLRTEFRDQPDRRRLQRRFEAVIAAVTKPSDSEGTGSWFFCNRQGVSLVRMPEGRTLGKNYAWRSFFHGGPSDQPDAWRPAAGQHLKRTQLSAVFRSQATSRWTVAISTPVFDDSAEKEFLGVVARTAEVGRFIKFPGGDEQFAVLIDYRDGANKGLVVQHPLFDALLANGQLPDRFKNYRVAADDLPDEPARQQQYADPLGADEEGGHFRQRWLAQMEPVRVRGEETGWLVIVQEGYQNAIGSTLSELRGDLVRYGLAAAAMIGLVMAGLWGLVTRLNRT